MLQIAKSVGKKWWSCIGEIFVAVSADFGALYCTNGASCKAAILPPYRTAKYLQDIYIIDQDMESQT